MLLRIWTKFKVEVSQWNMSLEPSLSQLWILKLNKNWVLNSLNKVESWKSTMQYVIKVHTQQLWIMKPSWWRGWKIDTSFFSFKVINKGHEFFFLPKYVIFPMGNMHTHWCNYTCGRTIMWNTPCFMMLSRNVKYNVSSNDQRSYIYYIHS
jgi:hypothetical protein